MGRAPNIDWDLVGLGIVTDAAIAEKYGCSISFVGKQRMKRGIAPCRKHRRSKRVQCERCGAAVLKSGSAKARFCSERCRRATAYLRKMDRSGARTADNSRRRWRYKFDAAYRELYAPRKSRAKKAIHRESTLPLTFTRCPDCGLPRPMPTKGRESRRCKDCCRAMNAKKSREVHSGRKTIKTEVLRMGFKADVAEACADKLGEAQQAYMDMSRACRSARNGGSIAAFSRMFRIKKKKKKKKEPKTETDTSKETIAPRALMEGWEMQFELRRRKGNGKK